MAITVSAVNCHTCCAEIFCFITFLAKGIQLGLVMSRSGKLWIDVLTSLHVHALFLIDGLALRLALTLARCM